MFKQYKYRIYPTKNQEVLLNKTFGCVRYIYNWGLNYKKNFYQKENKGISVFSLSGKMTKLKNEENTIWLKEVSAQSLQASLQNLDKAYTRFFKEKKGFPKFKSKSNRQSFQNSQHTKINFKKSRVYIPKFKEGILCIFDRKFKGIIKTSTISKTPSGKYFISILVDDGKDLPETLPQNEKKTLGLDLGIKNFYTDSNGDKIQNPRHIKKYEKKLARAQRKLSRKKKGSKKREKQRIRVAKIHEKISNVRKDFLHKVTTKLVENQNYNGFAIEDLGVQNMIKNHSLAKAISDVGWGEFRRQLEYKSEWTGKYVLKIGRFEPSSKMCSCGCLNSELTLKDRVWTCKQCGQTHDRDILAAQNIKRFAFCVQNTSKNNKIGQELAESVGESQLTPVETKVTRSLKREYVLKT